MSSSGGGIGTTITGGIQDIAAILPLLGTEQCSVQVTSALTRGYLYAAAAPMSIFGSLGVVIAGFKTLVACFSFRNINGAKILGNIGFEPQGENLSLIMVEAVKGENAGRYIIETRMDELITKLNIDKNRIRRVSHKSFTWNVKMMATTALLCAFSITPYIYLNLVANSLANSTRWVFPIVRAIGGFITATLIQLLIQQRITTLSDQYLVKKSQLSNADLESAKSLSEPHNGDASHHERPMDARTWLLLCFLFTGLVSSIVGYVGCFSIVQNSTSDTGPVSWLCLEVGLSVMRLAIWAYNPTSDDAPPLEIYFELDQYEDKPLPLPLPTCNKDNDEILQYKVLPLTRARDFLKIITSFAGLIKPFSNPDLSLYYTLTRKLPFKKSHWYRDEAEDAEKHKLGERTLYITVFDHKERTTRVYTRDNSMDIIYSTKSEPFVDVGHFLLEVEIDTEIDPKGDPVSSDNSNLDSLREHHQSILEHIWYRLGAGDVTNLYTIENSWTMKTENTNSALQRLREEANGDRWKAAVRKGKKKEQNEASLLICGYFMHPSIDRERRMLDENRVKWIARRMEMITKETKERLQGMGVEYRVNEQVVEMKATKSPKEVEQLLFREQCVMEQLLIYEVKEWEQHFWNIFKAFRHQIDKAEVEVKDRLTKEWRADCWKRLNPRIQKWLADFDIIIIDGSLPQKDRFLGFLGKRSAKSISQFFEAVENPYSISLSALKEAIEPPNEEIHLRMDREIEDIEFRLNRGSELERFDQCWDDSPLFRCRYSQSKWLELIRVFSSAPLEIYSHALKGNKNIVHITFSQHISDSDSDIKGAICDLPVTSISLGSSKHVPAINRDLPVTSISLDSSKQLPAINRDPLFNKSTNNDLIKFAKEIRPKLDKLEDGSTYIFTDADTSNFYTDKLGNNAKVLISFVPPRSGRSLILRLKHSGIDDGPLEVTLGSTIQLNPSSDSTTLTIDDITLHPIPSPGQLSFVPGRNDIVIQFTAREHGHLLHDVELLDEADLKDPRNQIITEL